MKRIILCGVLTLSIAGCLGSDFNGGKLAGDYAAGLIADGAAAAPLKPGRDTTVSLPGGESLFIPGTAVPELRDSALVAYIRPTTTVAKTPTGYEAYGPAIEAGIVNAVDGDRVQPTAEVTVTLTFVDDPPTQDTVELQLGHYVGNAWEFISATGIHAGARTVSGATASLSPFRAFVGPPPQSDAAVYPNFAGAGLIAVQQPGDYSSTSLSLLSKSGTIASQDFINSGSTTPKLSTAFSGDVVAAKNTSPDGSLVVIDRSNSVLTWIDPDDESVTAQMVVGEAFVHNPHDYLAISETKAYVSRFGAVFNDGKVESGDDLLIIDPSEQRELGRIALSDQAEPEPSTTATTYANPDRLLLVDGYVYAILQNFTANGSFVSGESVVVVIDPERDEVVARLVTRDIDNCDGATYARPVSAIILACSGNFGKGADLQYARSGVVVVDVSEPTDPVLKTTIFAEDFAPNQLGSAIGLVSPSTIAVISTGSFDPNTFAVAQNDIVYLVDTAAGADSAESIYEVDGAFQLTLFADPTQRRLYIGDAEVSAPKLVVMQTDENGSGTTRLDDLTFENGFPVRDMSVY